MPDDEASGDGDEVEVIEEAAAKSDEPNLLGLAGTPLPKFSTGLSSAALTGLTGQLGKVVASQAIFPAQIFKDSMFSWTKTMDQLGRGPQFVDILGKSPALSSFAATFTKDLKTFDQQLSGSFKLAQQGHALTAAWSKDVLGLSALTSWRTSLAIESSLTPLAKLFAEVQSIQSVWAGDLLRVTAAQVKLTDWVVSQDAGSGLLGAISGKPLSLWQDYADLAPAEPDVQWLRTSVAASSAGLGLLGADVLESDLEDAELVQATIERVEADVLAPSERGRLRLAKELYTRLGTFDQTVPEQLEGAWDDVERNGPAAASKAANCIVEALDRTLRAAAPEAAVREWHSRTGRPAAEFGEQGQVTRSLRVKYLAAETGDTRKLIVAQFDSLTKVLTPLVGRLQGVKHASAGDVVLVRSLLLTAEGFLTLLFLSTMT